MSPDSHLSRLVEKLKVAGHGAELVAATFKDDLEGRLIEARAVLVGRVGCDLLVGGHGGRSDVVGQEPR